MIIYEVSLVTKKQIKDSFQEWLAKHIRDMLGFEGFARATVFRPEQKYTADLLKAEPDEDCWIIHYEIDSLRDLENYFRDHAPQMRKDGPARYPGQMRSERRVLTPEAVINRT
jgi:hypothetical protein